MESPPTEKVVLLAANSPGFTHVQKKRKKNYPQFFLTISSSFHPGFMTNQEKELFQAVPSNEFNTYWIPCTWFVYRLQEAAKKGKLINEYAIETIMRVSNN